MENNKKVNTLIIILIVLVGFTIYQNISIRKEIDNISDRTSNIEFDLNNQLHNIGYAISNEIDNILLKQENMVEDYESTYSGVDIEKESIKTLFNFTLKQSDGQSKIYVNAATVNNTEGTDYECITTNGLYYSCDALLSYKDNYSINIYQKNDDGSVKKLNAHTYSSELKSEFENRTNMLGTSIRSFEEYATFAFSLKNKTFGEDSFKINNVVVKAIYDGEEVWKKEATSYKSDNDEAIEKLAMLIASGDTANIEIFESKNEGMSIGKNGSETGLYMINIAYSDTSIIVQKNNDTEFDYKIIVTYENGETYEFSQQYRY